MGTRARSRSRSRPARRRSNFTSGPAHEDLHKPKEENPAEAGRMTQNAGSATSSKAMITGATYERNRLQKMSPVQMYDNMVLSKLTPAMLPAQSEHTEFEVPIKVEKAILGNNGSVLRRTEQRAGCKIKVIR